jgi:catalase
MGDARQHIKERHIANCRRADPAYGEGVARALGVNLKEADNASSDDQPH